MQIKQRVLPESLGSLGDLSPILQRIYRARGISDSIQLDKRLQTLLPFNSLRGIEAACQRLEKALMNRERILIIGDFDADGATSTAVAVSALRCMGAAQVEYLVPNRFEFGYGLTPAIVEVAKKWHPNLIITVDNGIASIEGVDTANNLGIDVLITDHHLPAEQLPAACAIVNPNQKEDEFNSKCIAGVGVIFYVMLALRRHLTNIEWFKSQNIPEPNMAQFLDLVALGTVADVVALDQNNRILVNQGIARIRQGHCRPGIKALMEIANRRCEKIKESDLGYAIAPRLNAAGRLDDMSLGIECLLSQDINKARQLAEQLDELNQERKLIENEMKEQAFIAINKLSTKIEHQQHLPLALCLMDEAWHQGVIGILAGRLKDKFHRPVIAFSIVSEEEMKGSARSVNGLNIRDALAAVDRENPGLITKFGGHAMAAGLTISPKNFNAFREAFITEVEKHIDASHCKKELLTDGGLTAKEMSMETALLLQSAGPWGQQFPEPCFDNIFEVLDQRLLAQRHLKLTLLPQEGGDTVDAIAFNIDLAAWPNYRVKHVHVAYKLDINEYQGRSRLQLIVEAINVVTS